MYFTESRKEPGNFNQRTSTCNSIWKVLEKKREDLQYIMYLAEQFTHQAHHKTIIVATKFANQECIRLSPVRVYMYRRTLTNPTIVLFRLVNVCMN